MEGKNDKQQDPLKGAFVKPETKAAIDELTQVGGDQRNPKARQEIGKAIRELIQRGSAKPPENVLTTKKTDGTEDDK